MNDIDEAAIERFLDNAQLHAQAKNDWAEGFWLGRAVQHADQNAVDHEWLTAEFEARGLDAAVIAIPKPGDATGAHLN